MVRGWYDLRGWLCLTFDGSGVVAVARHSVFDSVRCCLCEQADQTKPRGADQGRREGPGEHSHHLRCFRYSDTVSVAPTHTGLSGRACDDGFPTDF